MSRQSRDKDNPDAAGMAAASGAPATAWSEILVSSFIFRPIDSDAKKHDNEYGCTEADHEDYCSDVRLFGQ